jgi:glutathione S-transferase
MPVIAFWNCESLAEGARPKVRVTYLDKRVRGESIRLALFLGGVPFEDEHVSYQEIIDRKPELPFSQVPVLDIGDGHGPYAQSGALLRWAGKEGGLYPTDSIVALRCDGVVDMIEEMRTEMIKAGYNSVMNRHPETSVPMVRLAPVQRMEVMKMNAHVVFPTRYGQLEKIFATGGGPFFCGDQICIADLAFYVLSSAIVDGAWAGNGVGPEVLDKCPHLRGLVDRIAALPKVAEWNAAHQAEWWG